MTKDWDSVRSEIKDLSVNQKKCLQDVKTIMETRHKFRASTRAYRMKLKEWGYMRNKARESNYDNTTPKPDGNAGERQVHSEDESETTVDAGDEVDVVESTESSDIVVDPWVQSRKISTEIVMDMLASVLEGDCDKLEKQ